MTEERRRHIIVTGLCASGKDTYSKRLANQMAYQYGPRPNINICSCDELRYGANWQKRPAADFIADVTNLAKSESPIIFQGAYLDAYDPEHAREKAFEAILPTVKEVIIIKPAATRTDHVRNIVRRSINRATGVEPTGTCAETPETVARMIVKQLDNMYDCAAALYEFESICFNNDLSVHWVLPNHKDLQPSAKKK